MDEKYQKFLSSRQPAVKLEIALREILAGSRQEAYEKYLRMRILSAGEVLTDENDPEGLEQLWTLGFLEPQHLQRLLDHARLQEKIPAFVWLLRKKQETLGFSEPDWGL